MPEIPYTPISKARLFLLQSLIAGCLSCQGTLLPQNLARKHGKTPAQILLRWNVQQGIIPIPKSKNPARLAENIAVFDFALEGEDMAALGGMNQNRRTSHDR